LSGRLTLGMLVKMQQTRENQKMVFAGGANAHNELDEVKVLIQMKAKLTERKEQMLAEGSGLTPSQLEQNLKKLEREEEKLQQKFFMGLKNDFKHINGMWPITAKFADECQRLESWQTSLVIKRKIVEPSKRLINCQKNADLLEKEQRKFSAFLKMFRKGVIKAKRKKEVQAEIATRGSHYGSSKQSVSCDSPKMQEF